MKTVHLLYYNKKKTHLSFEVIRWLVIKKLRPEWKQQFYLWQLASCHSQQFQSGKSDELISKMSHQEVLTSWSPVDCLTVLCGAVELFDIKNKYNLIYVVEVKLVALKGQKLKYILAVKTTFKFIICRKLYDSDILFSIKEFRWFGYEAWNIRFCIAESLGFGGLYWSTHTS